MEMREMIESSRNDAEIISHGRDMQDSRMPPQYLLERQLYLDALDETLREAAHGGRIALVSGEAGIGKTSLLEEFTATQRETHTVLWGGCDALFTPAPLAPLHDIAG